MVDDDGVNVMAFAELKGEKLKPNVLVETGDIRFAISTATLDQEIHSLEESMNHLDVYDIESTRNNIDEIQQQKELLKALLEVLPSVDAEEFKQLFEKDLGRLSYLDRWKIFSFWRAEIVERLAAEVNSLNTQIHQETNEMKDVETIETAEIISEAHVVGITTTGAAKQRALLEHLKSKIGMFSILDNQLNCVKFLLLVLFYSYCRRSRRSAGGSYCYFVIFVLPTANINWWVTMGCAYF